MSYPLLRASTASSDLLHDLASRDATMDLFSSSAAEVPDGDGDDSSSAAAAIVEAAVRPPIVVCADASPSTGVPCGAPQRLVWGFRYLRLWSELADRSCPVLVCSQATEIELLVYALAAENRAGAFRWSEIDRVVSACEAASRTPGDATESLTTVLRYLDRDHDVRPPLERYRRLPAHAAAALDCGTIDFRTAEAIPARLDDALGCLLPSIERFSFSNRRLVVRLSIELIRRDGLDAARLADALDERSASEALRWLRQRRYPRLTAMEDHLSEVRRRRLAGTGVEIDPPPNFEGDAYRVSFRLSSQEELRRRLSAAATLTEDLDGLLDLLF